MAQGDVDRFLSDKNVIVVLKIILEGWLAYSLLFLAHNDNEMLPLAARRFCGNARIACL